MTPWMAPVMGKRRTPGLKYHERLCLSLRGGFSSPASPSTRLFPRRLARSPGAAVGFRFKKSSCQPDVGNRLEKNGFIADFR